MKISSFELDLNGEKIIDNYSAIIKNKDILPKQILCMFKQNEKYFLKNFDRYIKIYEVFDDDKPDLESVIPKRIVKI